MFSRYCWLLRLHRMYHNNQSKWLNVYIIGIAIAIMKPFQFHSFLYLERICLTENISQDKNQFVECFPYILQVDNISLGSFS